MMKTKIALLCILLTLATTSCVTGLEGDTKDEIELTDQNTLYEGDVYGQYLTVKINELKATIEQYRAVGPNDENYDEAIDQIEMAEEELQGFNVIRDGIFSLEQVGLDIMPPCPGVIVAECQPRLELQNLIFARNQTIFAEISFIDQDENVLNTFNTLEPLEGFENSLFVIKTELPPVTGAVIMLVNKIDATEEMISYQQQIR